MNGHVAHLLLLCCLVAGGGCRKKKLDFLDRPAPVASTPAESTGPQPDESDDADESAPEPDDDVAPPALLVRHPYKLKVARGVRFAEVGDDVLTLDLFIPRRTDRRPALLVWFPGGAFVSYVVGTPRFDALAAQAGFAVAVVYYYLSTPARGQFSHGTRSWPQAYRSAGRALRFLRDHEQRFGIDTSRLAVGGFSAGGTVAAYVAAGGKLSGGADAGVEERTPRVLAAFLASAPLDLRLFSGPKASDIAARWPQLYDALSRFLGLPPDDPRARWAVRQANPLSVVRRDALGRVADHGDDVGEVTSPGPLWFLAHGALDRTVPVSQSRRMARVINRSGGAARLTEYPTLGHHAAVASEEEIVAMMRLVEAGP